MDAENSNAQRLAAYRRRLEEAGFKRVSAYVSLYLIVYLQSQKERGECLGRTLERLLLGVAKARPKYYSDEEIADEEARRCERAAQHAPVKKARRAEQREIRRVESERLRREAMVRLGLLKNLKFRGTTPTRWWKQCVTATIV